ncbi:MAG: flavodoxin family protein [Kineosporiaceae bacterium]|nr:flavodoxin family protein [Kineosporiaceae bacterium]MBK7621279.1 flavodoxin family protein [Kineosporiaceae bacterium]MBK8077566.1 flavodoxin family protein [Kineosporiaceae bacterium]
MPRLLVVHHTPSPAMQQMLEAVLAGARDPDIVGVDVVVKPALEATATDVLAAQGFLLGTPANIGYMSGALKHFFDQIYYPTLIARAGAPFGLWVHGADDVTGAVRAVRAITGGLGWRQVHEDVTAVAASGPITREVTEACYSLGGTVAVHLAES